jgi:hypothetical protein
LHRVAKQVLERQEVEFPPFLFMALLIPFLYTHKQRNYYKPITHSGKWFTKEFSADTCMCTMIVGR